MKKPLYLDNAASTPTDPRVLEKMLVFLGSADGFGNPASNHFFGKEAKVAVDTARAQVAELIHADADEIIWTSGATEANNLALKGASQLYQAKGKHIVTLKTEHPSVLDCCQYLEKQGFAVSYLSVEKNGLLDLEKFRSALRDDTILVSVMQVNNEIGIIQDIETIANITSERGILLHVDAAQSAGKISIDLRQISADLMSFSAHKIYGPKGMGALYVRRKPRVRVAAQIHGGGQESGMRSGTLATHQIIGMGEAFRLAKENLQSDQQKMVLLRDRFLEKMSILPKVRINSDLHCSVPHIINFRFEGKKSSELIDLFPELAFSAGSACLAKGIEPSYVLRALGQSAEVAAEGVRFSFGRFTTLHEVEEAANLLVARLQE